MVRRMSIRVSIVEDDADYRCMLEAHLNQSPDIRCVSTYGDPREALRRLPVEKPDVVLMDLQLPGLNGTECIAALRAEFPGLQAIMLTVFEQDEQVFQALAAGACGYLVKRTPPARILEAIREVQQGGSPMSAHIARCVVEAFRKPPPPKQGEAEDFQLSPREREILDLLAQGLLLKEIAQHFSVSHSTVQTHIGRIYKKLHVHSRSQAVARLKQQ
jgi:DNA-binding NarL/FixJ family response regulator